MRLIMTEEILIKFIIENDFVKEDQISDIDVDKPFKDIGIDSLDGVLLIQNLNDAYDLNLDAVSVLNFPTISKLVEYIKLLLEETEENVNG